MMKFSKINTLVAFVTVAREGSVSRAAEALNLTQPAISHQLKRLNEETGVTLFSRTATGLKLTRDGEALQKRAQLVLDSLTEFKQSAQRRTGQVGGKVRIGTIIDPEFIRLGQFLVSMLDNYPDIETELSHGVSGDIIHRLQRGQIDMGFYLSGYDPNQDRQNDLNFESISEMHFVKLADFRYRVIAPLGWQSKLDGKDWPELAALPWIGTPPISVHNRLLNRIFRQYKCTQNIVALVDQEASMLEMVRSGLGLCLCRESIALHQRQSFGIAVSERVSVAACMSFVTLDNRKEEPTIAAVIRLLEDVWHVGKSDL